MSWEVRVLVLGVGSGPERGSGGCTRLVLVWLGGPWMVGCGEAREADLARAERVLSGSVDSPFFFQIFKEPRVMQRQRQRRLENQEVLRIRYSTLPSHRNRKF